MHIYIYIYILYLPSGGHICSSCLFNRFVVIVYACIALFVSLGLFIGLLFVIIMTVNT